MIKSRVTDLSLGDGVEYPKLQIAENGNLYIMANEYSGFRIKVGPGLEGDVKISWCPSLFTNDFTDFVGTVELSNE